LNAVATEFFSYLLEFPYVPGSSRNSCDLFLLFSLNPHKRPWYYLPHLTGEATEAQKAEGHTLHRIYVSIVQTLSYSSPFFIFGGTGV
jgi:hypothetical protein